MGQILHFLRSVSVHFETETELKKSQICPICDQSDKNWSQAGHLLSEKSKLKKSDNESLGSNLSWRRVCQYRQTSTGPFSPALVMRTDRKLLANIISCLITDVPDLSPMWVRLATNYTNLGIFNISFSIFWLEDILKLI